MSISQGRPAPDDHGYLASVSDVMAGLIFVFIITLVVFALVLLQQEKVATETTERLTGSRDERASLLRDLQVQLSENDVMVQVDIDHGVLRLGERLLFASGRADLDESGRQTVMVLAKVLADILPCYTEQLPASRDHAIGCGDRGRRGRVEALFIEGHTDDLQPRAETGFEDNWELSTARARTIYRTLIGVSAGLDGLLNADQQPILSVSGYADRRAVKPNDRDDGRAANRRIDLRFVMMPPRDVLPQPAVETGKALGP
jgi:flagellar motor protein MotB